MVEHLTENQGVKSSILFVDKARLAQLVEQRTFNPVVIGSIPIPGIFICDVLCMADIFYEYLLQ